MNKRIKYAADKEEHVKKNPNLVVSNTSIDNANSILGLRMRNLPKKSFTNADFKNLFKATFEQYIKEQPAEKQKQLKKEKLLKQVKNTAKL